MVFMVYQQWVIDYGPQPGEVTEPATVVSEAGDDVPAIPELAPGPGQTVDAGGDVPELPSQSPDPQSANQPEMVADEVIRVTTDVLELEISPIGGAIQSAILLEYPVEKDRPDTLIQLLSPETQMFGRIDQGSSAEQDSAQQGGGNWPTWRGNEGTGEVPGGKPPVTWSEDENVVWKTPLPGLGNSTPVVWGDRLYLTTAVETDEAAATGAEGGDDDRRGRRRGRRGRGCGPGPGWGCSGAGGAGRGYATCGQSRLESGSALEPGVHSRSCGPGPWRRRRAGLVGCS